MANESGDQNAMLQDAIHRSGNAWAQGDLATLEALLSPTYTHTDAFGAFHDRQSWLDYVAGRAGRTTQIAFRDVVARIHGDVAIVTGINDLSSGGIRAAGDQEDFSLRFTQLWVHRSGKWLREAFQATPIRSASLPFT